LISNNNSLNSSAKSTLQKIQFQTEIPVFLQQGLMGKLFTPLEGANVDCMPVGQITDLNVLQLCIVNMCNLYIILKQCN